MHIIQLVLLEEAQQLKTFEKSQVRPLKEFSGPNFRRRRKKMELFEVRKKQKCKKSL